MGQPQRPIVDVHLLLVRDGKILLTQRHGGYAAGGWHAPSGKVENETLVAAVIREGREEVGVEVDPADLRCVHALHVQNPDEEPRIGWFFEATRWLGEPTNREPDKCARIDWFDLDGGLPDGMIPYPGAGIAAYRAGIPFSVVGFGDPHPRALGSSFPWASPARTS